MNHETRRAVAKVLRRFRKKLGVSRGELAKRLGWTEDDYVRAEDGGISLSEGQQNDVRRVMKEAADAASVRDRLRAKPRPKLWAPGGV